MAEIEKLMPVVGMENVLTVHYDDGYALEIKAGAPLDQDGNQILPESRCVSIRMANADSDDAGIYVNYETAFDLLRGLWLAVWQLSTWRERVKLLISYRW